MKNFVSHQIFVIVTGTCDTFYTPNLLFQFCFLSIFFLFSGVGVKLWHYCGQKMEMPRLTVKNSHITVVFY